MRAALVAGSIALLLGVSAASADTPERHVDALKTAKHYLQVALADENLALAATKNGETAQANKDLDAARATLYAMAGAADRLTPPLELADVDPKNPWNGFGVKVTTPMIRDELAQKKRPRNEILTLIQTANAEKKSLLALVANELNHLECDVLTNVQGPPTVNGVPQGNTQVTVEVSCNVPVKEVAIEIPDVKWSNPVDAGGDQEKLYDNATILEILARSERQVSIETDADPGMAPGKPLEVIVITRDRHHYYHSTL